MITVFAFLEAERNVKLNALKADASKYRPEVYKSEKSKILKTIQKVALGKLLNEMWFFLRSDNYYRRTEGGGGERVGVGCGYWFRGSRTGFYRPETACHKKIVFFNANNKLLIQKRT